MIDARRRNLSPKILRQNDIDRWGRGISSVKFGHRESGYILSMIVGQRGNWGNWIDAYEGIDIVLHALFPVPPSLYEKFHDRCEEEPSPKILRQNNIDRWGRGISSVKFGHRESGYILSMIVGQRGNWGNWIDAYGDIDIVLHALFPAPPSLYPYRVV